MENTVITFTQNELADILASGFDGSWVLNKKRAENCKYLVCCHSGGANKGSAFIVGEISRVIDAPDDEGKEKPRADLHIARYAVIDQPDVWQGWQNPVKYTSLDELGIELSSLTFQNIQKTIGSPQGLSIEEAKQGLAKKFDISPEQIEITIKA